MSWSYFVPVVFVSLGFCSIALSTSSDHFNQDTSCLSCRLHDYFAATSLKWVLTTYVIKSHGISNMFTQKKYKSRWRKKNKLIQNKDQELHPSPDFSFLSLGNNIIAGFIFILNITESFIVLSVKLFSSHLFLRQSLKILLLFSINKAKNVLEMWFHFF